MTGHMSYQAVPDAVRDCVDDSPWVLDLVSFLAHRRCRRLLWRNVHLVNELEARCLQVSGGGHWIVYLSEIPSRNIYYI